MTTYTAPPELTRAEAAAVAKLRRLALSWPPSLTLASMDGTLVVVRTDDERFADGEGPERQAGVITDIAGIPNTGGGW